MVEWVSSHDGPYDGSYDRLHDGPHLSPHCPLQACQGKHGSRPAIGVDGRVSIKGLLLFRLLTENFQQILLDGTTKKSTAATRAIKIGKEGGGQWLRGRPPAATMNDLRAAGKINVATEPREQKLPCSF